MRKFKVNIMFIILMIAALAFAVTQGGNLPYSVFYGFAITFILSYLYVTRRMKNIEVETKFRKQIYSAGESDEFTVIIKNLNMLPIPYLFIKSAALSKINSNYNGDMVFLSLDDSKWIRSSVKFTTRGVFNFGEIFMSLSDLFNIFELRTSQQKHLPIKVYPRVYNIGRLEATGNDIFKSAENNKSTIEDMYSIRDVREYRAGDSLKRINWKVSAKHGELYVKNFDKVSAQECNLFLDMSIKNYETDKTGGAEEQMVDLCASIVNHSQIKGIKSNVFINSLSNRNFIIEDREDYNELMEFFVSQKSDGESDYLTFINSHLGKIPRQSWVGIVTARIDEQMAESFIKMSDYGYLITVFYSDAAFTDMNSVNEMKRFGLECFSCTELLNKARE